MDIKEVGKNFGEEMEKAGEAMSEFAKLQAVWYKKSFWFRCWVRWDNLVFALREFFKKSLPIFIGHVIYRIKYRKYRFDIWRKK